MNLEGIRRGLRLPNGQALRLINPDRLQIDASYQRAIVPSTVNKIVTNFQENALGILTVCKRIETGILNVVDGQNRLLALREMTRLHGRRIREVLCLVIPNTTVQQEAMLFLTLNDSKPVTGNWKFRARIFDPNSEPEHAIMKMAYDEGFELIYLNPGRPSDTDLQKNGIHSVTTLLKAHSKAAEYLPAAFRMLREGWGNGTPENVPLSLRNGQVIYAITLFLASQSDRSGQTAAATFRDRNFDLASRWNVVRRETGCGYKRYQALADEMMAFFTGHRRRAA